MASTHTPDTLRGEVWSPSSPRPERRKYVLVLNPNSSTLMTDGMRALAPAPPAVAGEEYVYYTAPPTAPCSIDNEAHEHLSAQECFSDLSSEAGEQLLNKSKAVLVACFSNHPLAPLLQPKLPALTILDTAVLACLDREAPFGVITTTPDLVQDIDRGIRAVLDKYARTPAPAFLGTLPTGIRAIELKTRPREEVQAAIRLAATELLRRGAKSLILGCSGMSGADEAVQGAAREAGLDGVVAIDGVRAGMERLARV